MKIFRVETSDGAGTYLAAGQELLQVVEDALGDLAEGDRLVIEAYEMTPAELAALAKE